MGGVAEKSLVTSQITFHSWKGYLEWSMLDAPMRSSLDPRCAEISYRKLNSSRGRRAIMYLYKCY